MPTSEPGLGAGTHDLTPTVDHRVHDPESRLANRTAARAFVLIQQEDVVGYFSLTMGSVLRQDPPRQLARGLPAYPVGVALLARLAVDARHQGEGLGGLLLAEALRKAVPAGDSAAARLVVVDAIDDAAARFYAHHGFLAVPEHPMRLYRRIKDARASLNPDVHSAR